MSKTDRSEAARIADQLRRAFDGEAMTRAADEAGIAVCAE